MGTWAILDGSWTALLPDPRQNGSGSVPDTQRTVLPPPAAPVSEVEIARGGRGTNRSGDFDRSGLRGLMQTHGQRGQPTVVSDMWDTSGHAWTRHPRLAGARRIPSIATCTAKKRPGGRIERIETER